MTAPALLCDLIKCLIIFTKKLFLFMTLKLKATSNGFPIGWEVITDPLYLCVVIGAKFFPNKKELSVVRGIRVKFLKKAFSVYFLAFMRTTKKTAANRCKSLVEKPISFYQRLLILKAT